MRRARAGGRVGPVLGIGAQRVREHGDALRDPLGQVAAVEDPVRVCGPEHAGGCGGERRGHERVGRDIEARREELGDVPLGLERDAAQHRLHHLGVAGDDLGPASRQLGILAGHGVGEPEAQRVQGRDAGR
jgi:hypothetical protein